MLAACARCPIDGKTLILTTIFAYVKYTKQDMTQKKAFRKKAEPPKCI